MREKIYVHLQYQDGGKIAVHFVDYGNCYVAPGSSALALPARATEIPPLSFPVSLNDEAYIIPTGTLDATTVAQLTVETPTFNISISKTQPVNDVSTPLAPSKRPSINAVIKDSAKTLNVLDILAASGIVKLRTVQSPSAPTAATKSPATASSVPPPSTTFRAEAIPPCPYVPEVGESKKIVITEVISLTQIYVQVSFSIRLSSLEGSW